MTVVQSFAPRTGEVYARIPETSATEVHAILESSARAAPILSGIAPDVRRGWLDRIADALEAKVAEIVDIADAESSLGRARLEGEVRRTASQMRFYGQVAVEGSYLDATIDSATESSPRLVRTGVPLGPVVVFDSSNFPMFMGPVGNDTSSALAAGCPVIVKVHSAHARLGEMIAAVVVSVLRAEGAPEGTFAIAHGRDAGTLLVESPTTAAVGFTGSQSVGLHLWELANRREVVIPVYAEMGTVNPVLVTPAAGARRMDQIAKDFADGFTLAWGQYCTKPGLLFAPAGFDAAESVGAALSAAAPAPVMLTEQIADSVVRDLSALERAGGQIVAHVSGRGQGWSAPAAVVKASPESLVSGSALLEECFGAVAIVVEYDGVEQLFELTRRLSGSLGASVIVDSPDDLDGSRCVEVAAAQVGRVVINGWATGAAFTWAQNHGGPWPATSAPATTSIGSGALSRWTRPVAFQDAPDAWIPRPVQGSNPWGITRRVDGQILPAPR